MMLVIDSIQLVRSSKIRARKLDREGKMLGEATGHFLEPKDFDMAVKRLGIPEDIIRDAVDQYRKGDGSKPLTVDLIAKPMRPMFSVRGEVAQRNTGRAFTDFGEALRQARAGEVIEWQDTTWVCNLDIDFPHDSPSNDSIQRFIDTILPRPSIWWTSRSGVGAHLVYGSEGVFDADELAAIAAYVIQRRFPNCRVEFLCRTRTPPDSDSVNWQTQTADTAALRPLLSTFTNTDVDAYLEDKGWTVGMRLPHSDCPVNPSNKAKNNTPPVVIHADCVFCYVCAANGMRAGSATPGRFPFAALSGKRVNTQISVCIENLVHWSHAQHVVGSKVDNVTLGRKVYSALLKLRYGDDGRITNVFTAGEPNGLVRYQGHWSDNRGSTVILKPSSSILRSLPHCQSVERNGSVTTNPLACEWLSQPVDHSCRGFFPVVPLYGIQLTQFQDLPTDKIYSVQQSGLLLSPEMESKRPRYIPDADRMSELEAWATLEEVYPGMNRSLIRCLIAARGCSEHRSGLPPMLFITGPTGVGKTSHIEIAAAIVGDSCYSAYINRDRDRFNNEIVTSKKFAGFVNLDEIFKFGKQAGMSEVTAMESILSFKETANIYLIHVGAIQFGHMPVFVFSDTEISQEVKQHEQIGRRVFHFNLHTEMKWEKPLAESGIVETKYLRVNGSEGLIRACDSILSQVVDDFFLTPATDFADVCGVLDVGRLRDSVEMVESNNLIVELFEAVCNAKPIKDDSDKRRFSPVGFKIAEMRDMDKLYRCFVECQTEEEKGTIQCRVLTARELQSILGLKCPTTFEIRKHGHKLAMRFYANSDRNLVNERLRK